tara:strand:+ start:4862 stop:5017 length:156 start_codon:yes stop_codon:yes gene_type:complete
MQNKKDNPFTLKDLTKPANKEEDLKNYGPSYGMALSTAIDKKKAEEKEKDA